MTEARRMLRAEALLETAIYGTDIEALERFYIELLGLEPIARTAGRNAVLRCGSSVLILFNHAASSAPGGLFPPHGATLGVGHIAFAASPEDFVLWREKLAAAGVPIETEIQWADGLRSIYFRDPAGNSVEVAPATLWQDSAYRSAIRVSQDMQ
jgi:catechol 2,3-dioxygenase-like lactoylglutathione lyase family enzyme